MKNTNITSPKGKSLWAKLLVPDTKFNAEGLYSVDLIVDGNDATNFKNKLETLRQAKFDEVVEELKSKGKAADAKKVKLADLPCVEMFDDKGNETGELKFKFKMKAKITSKDGKVFEQKPFVVDAKGKPCEVNPWNDSVIKVACEVVPYYTALQGASVSLRLKAVQIIELVSGGSNGNSFGFDEEEGFDSSKEVVKAVEVNNEITDDDIPDF